uniref:Uncharacterized protein n=1 Tax=Amphimedon queenslandica TaxID=400682 RepID=A0A1X7V718_AMPQE
MAEGFGEREIDLILDDEMEYSPQRDGNSANLTPPPAPCCQGGFLPGVAEIQEEESHTRNREEAGELDKVGEMEEEKTREVEDLEEEAWEVDNAGEVDKAGKVDEAGEVDETGEVDDD